MKKETRVNLIFLSVFLVLIAPGAVLLVHKTLKNGGNRISQPDAVITRMPYMTVPIQDGMKWIVPDLTLQWQRDFLEGRLPTSAAPPGPKWEPVISDDHALQLMDVAKVEGGYRIALVLWQAPGSATKEMFKISLANRSGQPVDLKRADAADIPAPVRRELVKLGFTRPPLQVVWIEATTSAISPGDKIDLSYPGTNGPARTTVQVPLN